MISDQLTICVDFHADADRTRDVCAALRVALRMAGFGVSRPYPDFDHDSRPVNGKASARYRMRCLRVTVTSPGIGSDKERAAELIANVRDLVRAAASCDSALACRAAQEVVA